MLSEKTGCDVSTPIGVEILRNDIKNAIGESLGVNTLKRLVGLLEYEGTHRPVILDIVARYLGYSSWNLLNDVLEDRTSFFDEDSSLLNLEDLPPCQKIDIQWEPDRRIILQHQEGKIYRVVESVNSKLICGDILTLSQIAPGYPFYVSEVVRNGKSMGTFTAAMENGISHISLL